LITAITTANANGEANTITLEAGTYTLTAVDNDTDGPNGLPSVTSALTIQGAGADTTVIAREPSAPPFRLGHIAATGTLTVDRLTLQGGRGGSFGLDGAGLFNQGGILTLTNVTLANNNTFAFGTAGGGLFNNGGTVTLARTLLTRNLASFGGGLCTSGGTVLLVDSIVSSNGFSPVGTPDSGGILNENGGVLSLIHSTLTDNTAESGGGLTNRCGSGLSFPPTSLPCSTAAILESTIANNGATLFDGGGIINGGTLTLLNSTVASNSGHFGGGIDNAGTLIITNSTIANNDANIGGGIRNSGVAVLANTILAQNTASIAFPSPDCGGIPILPPPMVTSLGNNLIGDPTGCPITLRPTDLTGDPRLGAFTDNGTPGNGHFPLRRGSPAIDAGNDAFCPPADQLGRRRLGPCDIGAIRFRHRDNRQHDEKDDHHDKDLAAAAQAAQ
jgi:hypothetical protein